MGQGFETYIDDLLLPISPSSLKIKINSNNKTINLLNGSELNLLKDPGLTDITLDILLPSYNFSGVMNYKKQQVFLDKFEDLKKAKKKFPFIMIRSKSMAELPDTAFSKVTLEDYEIENDVKEGNDLPVTLKLKQYILPLVKKIKTTETQSGKLVTTTEVKKPNDRTLPVKHTVVKGDCLWVLCHKYLGVVSRAKCEEIAKKNKISNPNLIYPGQVIVFE